MPNRTAKNRKQTRRKKNDELNKIGSTHNQVIRKKKKKNENRHNINK